MEIEHGLKTLNEVRKDVIARSKETIRDITSGLVDEEVQLTRYKICEDCSEFRTSLRQCKMCYCFMPAKTMFKSSKCPKGLWDAYKYK